MILYKDKFTGDELFTDAYKVVDENTFFKFSGKLTTRKEGDIDDSLIGANASAEETQQEQSQGEVQSGLDFVLTAKLNEVSFKKKELQKYLKDYFKKLQEKCVPDDCDDHACKVKEFQGRAQEFVKFVMGSFSDLCFYFGESDYAGEHGCCFVKWLDQSEVEVYVFKEALEQEKY